MLCIAYIDEVHVFEPDFPSQSLRTIPELILLLPVSRPNLTGYIDSRHPHAINHLVISDIGSEEMLIVACDDGDVIGYTLRSIRRALNDFRKDLKAEPFERDEDSVPVLTWRPWFIHNVGQSAWGLATHKAQRLLAVSSNTKQINIFAFALTHSDPVQDSVVKSGEQLYLDNADESLLLGSRSWNKVPISLSEDRSKDMLISIHGHHANIPNIAFYESNRNEQETYLASTDINGHTVVWEVWTCEAIIETHLDLGNTPSKMRGWGVACIDPRSHRITSGQTDTFGCIYHSDPQFTVVDISIGAQGVKDNSQWHPSFKRFASVPVSNPPQAIINGQQPDSDSGSINTGPADDNIMELGNGMGFVDDEFPEDDLEGSNSAEIDNSTATAGVVSNSNGGGGNDPGEPSIEELDSEATESLPDESSPDSGNSIMRFRLHGCNSNRQDLVNPSESNATETYNDIIHISKYRVPSALLMYGYKIQQLIVLDVPPGAAILTFGSPRVSSSSPGENMSIPPREPTKFRHLPFSLLQTTESDIYLFRNLAAERYGKARAHSQVICRKAVQQAIPPGLSHLQHIERLNMVLQVPELSIVVVGNQAGRVGILTMTTWQKRGEWQPNEELEGFKIEFILPLRSQEERGLRPEKPLMGIAVGPIQGHETRPDQRIVLEPEATGTRSRVAEESSRRFRLMMIYYDHTILSYEISRQPESDEMLVI